MSGSLSYLTEYLPRVLGVPSFLMPVEPEPAGAEVSFEASACKILFLIEQPLSAAALDIFQKMTIAMKLGESDYRLELGSFKSSESISREWTVAFMETPTLPSQASWTHTISPEVLVKQPELKRKVWQDLQSVMKSVKID